MDKTHFIAIDLSSSDDIRRAAIEANEWAGGCADILVNNGESGGAPSFSRGDGSRVGGRGAQVVVPG